jgi:hypothetical protein
VRTRIGIGIEVEIDQRGPAVLGDERMTLPPQSHTDSAIRGAWAATCWLGSAMLAATCWLCPVVLTVVAAPVAVLLAALAVVGFLLLELLLLAAAAAGLLGRGLDHAGHAAARNSKVIGLLKTASTHLLPPPKPIEATVLAVRSAHASNTTSS